MQKWSSAARHLKSNKEAKLLEGKVCFISEASSGGGGGEVGRGPMSQGRLPPPAKTQAKRGGGVECGWVLGSAGGGGGGGGGGEEESGLMSKG